MEASGLTFLAGALAAALGVGGAVSIYLISPNQRLLARRPPWRVSLAVGLAGLVLSLSALLRIMGPAAAAYTLTMLAMTVWSLLPFLLVAPRVGRGR